MFAERLGQRLEPGARVAHQRLRVMLAGIERLHVEADDPPRRIAEQRPGSGGEVLQPRADREHQVGLRGERVGGARPRHADRPHVEQVIVTQRALAGLRLGHRNGVALREGRKRRGRVRIVHAAARDDQRPLRRRDQPRGFGELARIRPHAPRRPDALGEEALRIVVRLGLRVLAQRQRHRSARRRIGQHVHGARQRRDDLLRPRDAVEIARHRAEAVVGRDRAVREILDLLQHRIGAAVGEHVAGQQQHRQAVDMRDRRRRHHVGRARPDRRGAGHHAPPAARLGERDRRMRHRLLVVRPVGRQRVARRPQRLAERRHVAVAEDRPHAGEQRLAVFAALDAEVAHERLRHGEFRHCAALVRPAGSDAARIPSSRPRSGHSRH